MRKLFFLAVAGMFAVTAMAQEVVSGILSIPTVANATITVERDGIILPAGSDVLLGDILDITYASKSHDYYIDGPTHVKDTVEMGELTTGYYSVAAPVLKFLDYPYLTMESLDEESMKISWANADKFDSIVLCVSDKPIMELDPAVQKGIVNVTGKSSYIATGLKNATTYEIAILGFHGTANHSDWQTWYHYALPTNCLLTINMHDSYSGGDGWNGAVLLFTEGGETTGFTIEYGDNEAVAYYQTGGTSLQIQWIKGSYDGEASFEILDGSGNVLLSAATGDCVAFTDGQILWTGIACNNPCDASVSNLAISIAADRRHYNFSWDGANAAKYEVVIAQKPSLTLHELDSLKIEIAGNGEPAEHKVYTFEADSFAVFKAYVRPVCADGSTQPWKNMIAQYAVAPNTSDDVDMATPITLDHYEEGESMEAAKLIYGQSWIMRSFELTEPADVYVNMWSNYGAKFDYLVEGDASPHVLSIMDTTIVGLPAGKYSFEIGTSDPTLQGRYGMDISIVRPLEFDTIKLGETKTGSMLGAQRQYFDWVGERIFVKPYILTLEDTTQVRLTCASKDDRALCVVLQKDYILDVITDKIMVLPDTTLQLLVVSYTNQDLDYRLQVTKVESKALEVIDITPNVTKESRVEAADAMYYGQPVKVYRYTPSADEDLIFSIDTLPGSGIAEPFARLFIYRDSINGSYITYGQSDESAATAITVEKDLPYYFIISGELDTKWRFTLQRNAVDYDHLPSAKTMEVNRLNHLQFTKSDLDAAAHTGDFSTKAKCFKVHLEKDKRYVAYWQMDEKLSLAMTIFYPDSATGSYSDNKYKFSNFYGGYHYYVFQVDSTADYPIMVETYAYKDFQPFECALEIDEYISFTDFVFENAKIITTPYVERNTFDGTIKVANNDVYEFFSPAAGENPSYVYNAVAYNVIVKPYNPLYIEYAGNYDGKLFVYDCSSDAAMKSPASWELEANVTTRQSFMLGNSTPKLYTVVCAIRGIMLEGTEYNISITQGDEEIELKTVTPVADRQSVSLHPDDTEREALIRLSQINLYTVDKKGNYVFTLENNPNYWHIDYDNLMAHYEVNNSDMRPGYQLANPVEWIDVAITLDNDIPFGLDETGDEFQAIKVLRNGQLLIITKYGTFDIFGRKVK